MIRTGDEYRESIRDGREVWIDGERVADVTTHPAVQADGRRPRAHLRHGPRGRPRSDLMSYPDAATAASATRSR